MDVTASASIETGLDAARAAFRACRNSRQQCGRDGGKTRAHQDEKDWDKVIDTNLKGVWLAAQAAGRRMVENKRGGSIVNIASILGLRVAGAVGAIRDLEGGRRADDQGAGARMGAPRDPRQCACARIFRDGTQRQIFCSEAAGQALIKRMPQRRLGELRELEGPLLLLASGRRFIHDRKRDRRRRWPRCFDSYERRADVPGQCRRRRIIAMKPRVAKRSGTMTILASSNWLDAIQRITFRCRRSAS